MGPNSPDWYFIQVLMAGSRLIAPENRKIRFIAIKLPTSTEKATWLADGAEVPYNVNKLTGAPLFGASG
jgi:hypothetical protein